MDNKYEDSAKQFFQKMETASHSVYIPTLAVKLNPIDSGTDEQKFKKDGLFLRAQFRTP